MTNLFIKIYNYLKYHRVVMWLSMVILFIVTGFFASQIHMEEDLNKLMPSSKNEDGTTKMAFADLRIKDKTYLLFEYLPKKGEKTEVLTAVCDEFVDSLMAIDAARDSSQRIIGDVFYSLPEDLMFDGIGYLTDHLPAYIDTTAYAAFDTLLTKEHIQKQMQQNAEDMQGEFGEMFPELIQMDPIGMRGVLMEQMQGMMQSGAGSYSTINGHFFVPDSTVCIAFISPIFSATNTGQGSQLFRDLNCLIDSFAISHPDVRIVYHGTPASGYYNSSTIKNDLTSTISWSLLLVLVVLFICMRNWNTIPLLLLPVAFGSLFGLSLMYFIKGQFSLLALGIGAIVLGVAMSYVLHIITHYKYVGDAEQVLRDEVKPVLLGCLTTIGSFMGLIFIKTDLLQDFGLFAAFAIIGTTVFSLIYLPHLMQLEKNKTNKKAFSMIDRFNGYHFENSKVLLGVIGVVAVVCIAFYVAKGTDFDANMDNLGYRAERIVHSENLISEKTYTGDGSTYFASQGKTMEEALENFSLLSAKLDSLKAKGLVKSYTPTNVLFVPLKKQQERIDAWKRYWTDERLAKVQGLINATASQAGFTSDAFQPFFDAAKADYEPSALYEADIIPQGYLSTLMEQTLAGDYLCFTSVCYKGQDLVEEGSAFYEICQAIADKPNMLVLNTTVYTTDGLKNLNSDFNILQWVSMAFVFVVLLLSFRFNIKNTLLGFAPILLSWLIVLGAMAIFNVRFNLINIIISTFIFGIGVDYSIFIMSGLVKNDDGNDGTVLAYHKTAIFFSAFILVVTVASMLMANHPAIKSVGFATLVGMVSAVVLSYVVQPAIYKWLSKK
ncbi:MAG: MMPL family transporter [Prevotella sp.]|nr:MMPL family transporter [Candidatus Prevotella equi]